jgi:hypothetical protein
MTDPVSNCSRCGMPIVGPVFTVRMECVEVPPKQPELFLCLPCMESLNHWLLKRQHAARAILDKPVERAERLVEPSTRPARVRRPRKRTHAELTKTVDNRNARVRTELLLPLLRMVLFAVLTGGAFFLFWTIGMNSGWISSSRPKRR